MSNAPTLHNSHRNNVAFYVPRTSYVLTVTPTAANEEDYEGSFQVYDSNGAAVGDPAEFAITSDTDATAAEIVTGITADLVGTAVETYGAVSGTSTLILTMDEGYTVALTSTGTGTLTPVASGYAANLGAVPADAAAWATAETNTSAGRVFVEEADPAFIRGKAANPNVDMDPRVFGKQAPHKGLPTADGGSIKMRLWGTGSTYSAGAQVEATMQGRMLKHALGGGSRGNHTTVTTVTNQTTFTLTAADSMAVGQIIWFEDAGDVGRLWPAQILTKSGADITIDRVMPFTVATSDKVYGSENAWPDQAALTNPQDSGAETCAILYQRGPDCWVAGGAHLALTTLEFERGMQPKGTFEVLAAKGYGPGFGGPEEPTWTGSPEGLGLDVQPVGRDTKCFLQTYDTTTHATLTLFSASVNVGVPVVAQDTVTEADDGMPGRAFYATQPADTTIELVVAMEDNQQTRWEAGTYLTLTYYQVGPVGHVWAVHCPRAFMMEAPEPVFENSNRYRIRVQATDDWASDKTTEAARAKILIARA